MTTQAYSQEIILSLVAPEVLAIPIQENEDPLVDLREQSLLSFGPSPEILNNQDYTKIRNTVYKKLIEAQKALPSHLQFCLYEGYRSLQLQDQLFHARYALLKKQHPLWSHATLFQETVKLVSPVLNLDGSRNTPAHATGGAIDIYLMDTHGEIVDMGIKVADWMTDVDGSLSQTQSTKISAAAKQHRAMMSTVLKQVGFVNYAAEYWHWSFGDRYWAYHVGATHALYDTVIAKK